MMHNHPSDTQPPSKYCQQIIDGQRVCRFGYPKPLQLATTIDRESRVHYRRCTTEDAMVVPHCLPLLRLLRCHINVEAASSSQLFQYIFKYIHKGMNYKPLIKSALANKIY